MAMSEPDNAEATKCIQELLDAMDTFFPDPERVTDKPFLMPIEDVFTISGRGTVVTGRVDRGIVKVKRDRRDRRHQADQEHGRHRRRDVQQAA